MTIDLTRNFRDISFSPDGTKLILQSEGFDRAEIRESPTGRLLTETDEINENLPLHFLADNKTIASTRLMSFSGGSTLNIKYLRTELAGESADRFILFENFNGSYFNPNGQSILTTSESGVARLWDAAPQQSGSKVIRESGFSNTILSGNGHVLAVLNNNGEVKFFNADDRSQLGTTLALNTAKPHPTVFTGPYDREYFPLLTVSNDGRFICIRQRGTSSAILWDTSGKRAVPVLTSGKHAFGPAAFSANSEMFGVAAPDLTVQIWKNLGAESPELLTWKQSDPVNALYFSPTGKYVAAICVRTNKGGAYDRLVKVFDVAANREISLNTSLGDLVGVLRVSDNGKLVVGFGGERASQPVLYDLNTGTSSKLTHPAALTGVALSGSGTYLVTGCADGTVRLWDTNTGNLIGSPEKFGAIIRSVKISGDDKTVLAFSDQWIHASLITPEGLKYRSGQFTNSLYSGVSILNPEGTLFRHLLFTSQDTIGISDFSLNSVGNIPITAPEILLDSWTQKLGVTLDDHGQVGARSNPSPSP